jgi:hypothetical protein
MAWGNNMKKNGEKNKEPHGSSKDNLLTKGIRIDYE